MNKLFTKIASLSVGLAMAIGVGVAIGGKDTRRAEAATGSVQLDASTATDLVAGYSDTSVTIAHTTSNVTASAVIL